MRKLRLFIGFADEKLRAAMLLLLGTEHGVVIAGGMLIPGNIPNIISASKLGISSRSWAVIGVPLGLVLMAAYFLILFVA